MWHLRASFGLLLLAAGVTRGSTPDRCKNDQPWVTYFSEDIISWEDADAACAAMGTTLARWETVDDMDILRRLCMDAVRDDGDRTGIQSNGCWAGVYAEPAPADSLNTKIFLWADGSGEEAEPVIGSRDVATNAGWGTGEPTAGRNGRVERCALFQSNAENPLGLTVPHVDGFYLNDLDCSGDASNIRVHHYTCVNLDYRLASSCLCQKDTCFAWGDPHTQTFDGLWHHFQGNCTYQYATGCFDADPIAQSSNYVPFDVFSKHGPCYMEGVTCIQDRTVRVYTSDEVGKVDLEFKLTQGLSGEVVYDLWADEYGDNSRTDALNQWIDRGNSVDDVLIPWDCPGGPSGCGSAAPGAMRVYRANLEAANTYERTATVDLFTNWFYDNSDDYSWLRQYSQIDGLGRDPIMGDDVATTVGEQICDLQTVVSETLDEWGWTQIDIAQCWGDMERRTCGLCGYYDNDDDEGQNDLVKGPARDKTDEASIDAARVDPTDVSMGIHHQPADATARTAEWGVTWEVDDRSPWPWCGIVDLPPLPSIPPGCANMMDVCADYYDAQCASCVADPPRLDPDASIVGCADDACICALAVGFFDADPDVELTLDELQNNPLLSPCQPICYGTDCPLAGTALPTESADTPQPTPDPTTDPTPGPTPQPTPSPTGDPTPSPTPSPTPLPTQHDVTPPPSPQPTPAPTMKPTADPTPKPTPRPTDAPVVTATQAWHRPPPRWQWRRRYRPGAGQLR